MLRFIVAALALTEVSAKFSFRKKPKAPSNSTTPDVTATASAFNLAEANKHLWLSAAAYCGSDKTKTHTFKGPTTGFVVTYVFDDHLDTQGFVGYLPSDKSIYVSFRGSSNIQNWITNFQLSNVKFNGDCCGLQCTVHKGFYKSEQAVFPGILKEVQRLKKQFSSYPVKVTGHSLGGALATVTSVDLKNNGIASTVYTFGSPRVGDANFASCATTKAVTERVVHLKDMVPQIPFENLEYKHVCREAYETSSTSTNPQVKDCSTANCEDPTCSYQWKTYQTNVNDHLLYLGLAISDCKAVS